MKLLKATMIALSSKLCVCILDWHFGIVFPDPREQSNSPRSRMHTGYIYSKVKLVSRNIICNLFAYAHFCSRRILLWGSRLIQRTCKGYPNFVRDTEENDRFSKTGWLFHRRFYLWLFLKQIWATHRRNTRIHLLNKTFSGWNFCEWNEGPQKQSQRTLSHSEMRKVQ